MRGLSNKERCVLELLGAGELYGLELVDASGGELKRGTVYVTLSRMEEKGLVLARSERAEERGSHPGLPRRRYRISALGARLLAAEGAFERALGRLRAGGAT